MIHIQKRNIFGYAYKVAKKMMPKISGEPNPPYSHLLKALSDSGFFDCNQIRRGLR